MELSILKRDMRMLVAILGVKGEGDHHACPFHKAGDSFSVWRGSDGVCLWKCHAGGCGSGTIIDAAMLLHGVKSCHDALLAIERDLGVPIMKDEEYIEPRVDTVRATEFVNDAHANLMRDPALIEKYLTKKRGISIETAEQYKLGFANGWGFKGKNWDVFGWSIPVTDAKGNLIFVKLHTERPPWPEGPKCLAAPFGTYPEKDPKHGTNTLWPAPETFGAVERLYLCPGELKALSVCSAGFAATSPTTGENKLPDRMIERIKRCKPGAVFIVFDDDKPKLRNGKWVRPGCDWRDKMLQALSGAGVTAYAFAYGGLKLEQRGNEGAAGVDKFNLQVRETRADAHISGNIRKGSNDNSRVENKVALPVQKNTQAPVRLLTPDEEWLRLEDKLVREAEARGEECAVAPEATKQDLKNLIALSTAVVRQAFPTQDEILAKHGLVSEELSRQMPRFHRKPIGKCRT